MKKKYSFKQLRILFFLLLSVLTTSPLFANRSFNSHTIPTATSFVDLIRRHNGIENAKTFSNDDKPYEVISFDGKTEFGIIDNSATLPVTNSADKISVILVRSHSITLSVLEKTYILLRQFNN